MMFRFAARPLRDVDGDLASTMQSALSMRLTGISPVRSTQSVAALEAGAAELSNGSNWRT